MLAFVVRRLLSGLLVVVLLTFLTFVIFELIPVNPACQIVGCGPGTSSTDADLVAANHEIGVDRPVVFQYARFVWRLARHGSLGASWIDRVPVEHLIAVALPPTVAVVLGGLVLLLLIALPLGCIAALRPRTFTDHGLLAVSIVGIAIHPFVLALILRDAVAPALGLPQGGYCPLQGGAGCNGAVDWVSHLVLPWLCFALFFVPVYVRMIRVRLLETLGEPFVTTARAKGASERRVVTNHVIRNAIGPIVPMVAADAGTALTAAIYIEVIFVIPGLGRLALHALGGQSGGYDRPLVVGIVATVGLVVVLFNVVADVAGAALDPRIRMRAPSGFLPQPALLRRIPRAAGAGIAVAAAVLVGFAVYTHGDAGRSAALTGPVKSVRLDWQEDHVFSFGGHDGDVVTAVHGVRFGSNGWRVDAVVSNHGKEPLLIRLGAAGQATFSLVLDDASGSHVLGALDYWPAMPETLRPGESWAGTFGGVQHVPPGRRLQIGFGGFAFDRDAPGSEWITSYGSSTTP